MPKTKKAFTLIELLVVIAIIGILVTIAVIALNSARSKARDAKRVANIKQVQTALELFFNDKNRYPTLSEYNSGALYSTSSFNGTTTYMEIVPEAPTPPDGACSNLQNQFSYTPTNNGGSYTISYCLGNPTGSIAEGPHCATPSTIAGGACDGSGGSTGSCTPACTSGQTCVNGECVCAPISGCGDLIFYGGENYPTVQIGCQCLMTKNLNIGTILCSGSPNSNYCGETMTNNSQVEKYCYYNNEIANSNGGCSSGGGLYTWSETMGFPDQCNDYDFSSGSSNCGTGTIYTINSLHQGICPSGWHIPSYQEYGQLSQTVINDSNCDPETGCSPAGDNLKIGGSSGFEGLMAGTFIFGNGSLFGDWGTLGSFWTSRSSGGFGFVYNIFLSNNQFNPGTLGDGRDAASVRCIKN